jgi:hypothetical protein
VKGISTRKTRLGWTVIRIHYSADPDKDPETPVGAAWLEHAQQGMSKARWRKEFEIDYEALGGQLVFPNFEETIHVTKPQFPLEPATSTIYLAADPHPRTPHAFLWLAAFKSGELAVVWSHWREEYKKQLVSEYAAMLHKIDRSPLGLKPHRRIMDVAGKSFNVDEERDIFKGYRDAKLTVEEQGKVTEKRIPVIFHPAKKDIGYVGLDLINEEFKPVPFAIADKIENRPRLTIWSGCGDNDELVYQLKSMRFREHRGNITDKDAPEEPQEKRSHLIACLKYIMLEKPRYIEPRTADLEEKKDLNTVIASPQQRSFHRGHT